MPAARAARQAAFELLDAGGETRGAFPGSEQVGVQGSPVTAGPGTGRVWRLCLQGVELPGQIAVPVKERAVNAGLPWRRRGLMTSVVARCAVGDQVGGDKPLEEPPEPAVAASNAPSCSNRSSCPVARIRARHVGMHAAVPFSYTLAGQCYRIC